MRFPQPYTLKQIATIIGAEWVGNEHFPVLGMNEIHVVQPGDIVFVDHPKYYDKALRSYATVVLINKIYCSYSSYRTNRRWNYSTTGHFYW